MATKKRSRKPRRRESNPRVPCGAVSNRHNRYVGATYVKRRGKASGHRRVVGCARVGDDDSYYATREVGTKGTRYTPLKKRALRDLRSTSPRSVKVPRHKGVTHTSGALKSAWDKRYGVKRTAKGRFAKKGGR